MVYVTGDDPVRALSKPFVDVLSDTTALNRTPAVRSGVGDTLGRLRWDSLPAGRYGLLVRRLGYEILRRVIVVRPGGVDTLLVTLRTQVMCHAP